MILKLVFKIQSNYSYWVFEDNAKKLLKPF